jgi:hypothetical protein
MISVFSGPKNDATPVKTQANFLAGFIGCPTREQLKGQKADFLCYWLKRPISGVVLGIGAIAIYSMMKK